MNTIIKVHSKANAFNFFGSNLLNGNLAYVNLLLESGLAVAVQVVKYPIDMRTF